MNPRAPRVRSAARKLAPPLTLYWPLTIGPAPLAGLEAVDWVRTRRRGRTGSDSPRGGVASTPANSTQAPLHHVSRRPTSRALASPRAASGLSLRSRPRRGGRPPSAAPELRPNGERAPSEPRPPSGDLQPCARRPGRREGFPGRPGSARRGLRARVAGLRASRGRGRRERALERGRHAAARVPRGSGGVRGAPAALTAALLGGGRPSLAAALRTVRGWEAGASELPPCPLAAWPV